MAESTRAASTQRKLPNPKLANNGNPSLKGILNRPKRILPAHPESPRSSGTDVESANDLKYEEVINETKGLPPENSDKDEASNEKDKGPKVTLPKLYIDVERLKCNYQLNNANKDGKNLDENTLTACKTEKPKEASESNNSVSSTIGTTDSAFNRYNMEGLAKVSDWYSARETGKMTAKIATDPFGKPVERSIRSPSPKSNTTWERSSSGYSSDERTDTRSPLLNPNVCNTCIINTASDLDRERMNASETSDKQDKVGCDNNEITETCGNDNDKTLENNAAAAKSEQSGTSTLISVNDEPETLTKVPDTGNDIIKTENENNDGLNLNQDRNETTGSCVNLTFDNSIGVTTGIRSHTSHSPFPKNGRVIQYRKPSSDSSVSVMTSSGHGVDSIENSLEGLDVCGKSFQASARSNTTRFEHETGTDQGEEKNLPSAITPVPKLLLTEKGKDSSALIDLRTRKFMFRPQTFITHRGLQHGKVSSDDKEIRRTLHNLGSHRSCSPGRKAVPIRARHLIQPNSDSKTVTNPQISGYGDVIRQNRFSKKMWRAPSGQSESFQGRPFSPFGGTLPAAKIKENEQMKHHGAK
ncbi:hypothetical protein ACF0H5_017113 [Mactra antiquata]